MSRVSRPEQGARLGQRPADIALAARKLAPALRRPVRGSRRPPRADAISRSPSLERSERQQRARPHRRSSVRRWSGATIVSAPRPFARSRNGRRIAPRDRLRRRCCIRPGSGVAAARRREQRLAQPDDETAAIGIVIERLVALHQQRGRDRASVSAARAAGRSPAPRRTERAEAGVSSPPLSQRIASQTSAAAPATIRYQPNGAKPCLLTMPMNHLITTRATTKETTKPSAMPPAPA